MRQWLWRRQQHGDHRDLADSLLGCGHCGAHRCLNARQRTQEDRNAVCSSQAPSQLRRLRLRETAGASDEIPPRRRSPECEATCRLPHPRMGCLCPNGLITRPQRHTASRTISNVDTERSTLRQSAPQVSSPTFSTVSKNYATAKSVERDCQVCGNIVRKRRSLNAAYSGASRPSIPISCRPLIPM